MQSKLAAGRGGGLFGESSVPTMVGEAGEGFGTAEQLSLTLK